MKEGALYTQDNTVTSDIVYIEIEETEFQKIDDIEPDGNTVLDINVTIKDSPSKGPFGIGVHKNYESLETQGRKLEDVEIIKPTIKPIDTLPIGSKITIRAKKYSI